MVSLVAQPTTPLAIFLCHQASKSVSSCQAHCQALLWRALSVGCSSLEDESFESLEGVPSLGLGWCHFCWADWIFSSVSDSASVTSCIPKMWLTPVRVFWIGAHPWPSLPLPSEAARPLLKTSTSPSLQGVSSSWEGSDLLLVSWPSSVTWDWAEPDCWLWSEVILWAQLSDRLLEPHGPPDPTEPLEMVGEGGWSTPSLPWWVTPPNTLVRVRDALTLWRGRLCLVQSAIFCKQKTPAVGDGEWYLCLKGDIHRDLWEQVEHVQHET